MPTIAKGAGASLIKTGAPTRPTPNLDAQLRTYRAQLADWVTCPSAKTPQGKAKIEQISAKLASVENEIKKKSDPASSSGPNASPPKPIETDRHVDGHSDYLSAPNQVGSNVDTFV